MRISLEPGQYELLQAIADDQVARHRASIPLGPANGTDLRTVLAAGPLGLKHRRVATQIAALRRLKLVDLVHGQTTDQTWPWRLTTAGQTVVDDHRERAETTATDQP